jgi:hypothetical protein
MAEDRSVPRDVWYVVTAFFGLILTPLTLCVVESKSFTYGGVPKLVDWAVWFIVLICFVFSLLQAIASREISPRGPEIEHRTPKTFMYRLGSFIKICADHFGAGAAGLVSGTVSFLYVISILSAGLGWIAAAYAILQSTSDSISSFLEAPVGTKPGHINYGFGADWGFYLLLAIVMQIVFWVIRAARRRVRKSINVESTV